LLDPFWPAVELREHGRASVLDFILRLAGPQAFGKITPESIEARIGHFQKTGHELRAGSVEEHRRFFGIT
jgi:hypothetical protein